MARRRAAPICSAKANSARIAAAARGLARSPEAMALFATAFGALSVLGGLWLSLRLDTPAGPSIVAAAAVIFALSLIPRRAT